MSSAAKRDEGAPVANDNAQTWFTTKEAAHYLRMSPAGLQKHVERGRLRPATSAAMGKRFGHRFKREALDAFITGGGFDGG